MPTTPHPLTWNDWLSKQPDLSQVATPKGFVGLQDQENTWITTAEEWARVLALPADIEGDDSEDYADFCNAFDTALIFDAIDTGEFSGGLQYYQVGERVFNA